MAINGTPLTWNNEEEGRSAGRSSEQIGALPRPCDRIPGVGFNPFRQQRRRSTDYVMVAAAFAVVAVLLIWAVYPR